MASATYLPRFASVLSYMRAGTRQGQGYHYWAKPKLLLCVTAWVAVSWIACVSAHAGQPDQLQLGPARHVPVQSEEGAWVISDQRSPDSRKQASWRDNLVTEFDTRPDRSQNQLSTLVEELGTPESDTPAADAKPLPPNPFKRGDNQPESVAGELVAQPTECFVAEPMASLSVNIALPSGLLPDDVAAQCAETTAARADTRSYGGWAMTEYHWSATCAHHRPLYFEEINAERYGYTPSECLQPLISAGRFFATIPALPYLMAVDCPRECIYTLGHDRPGSCAPRRWHRLPCQASAVLVETATIAGLILLIP